MVDCSSTTGELGPSCDSQRSHPGSSLCICFRTNIHTLDAGSLLNVFQHCRPTPHFSDETGADAIRILGGGNWNRERWWYSLAHVCRRWRHIVLESASPLGLSLVCTYGTPVADLLAYLPPLLLIIDYHDLLDSLTADDERGIALALQNGDRVRCIRLLQPAPVLQRLFEALQGEFPNLEYLIVERPPMPCETSATVDFPKTFRAPRLRFVVTGLHISNGPPSLTTIGKPVTPSLEFNFVDRLGTTIVLLLKHLLTVPQRETLESRFTCFNTYFPSHDIDRQSLQRALMRRATPYLRWFGFQGANSYLEMLLPQIRVTIPLFERLRLYLFDQLIDLILHRRQVQIMETIPLAIFPNLLTLTFTFFNDHSRMHARSVPLQTTDFTLNMGLESRHLDLQVARTAQVCHMLGAIFFWVVNLKFKYDRHLVSSDWNDEADRSQWRELLRLFGSARTLHIEHGLVRQIARSLQPGEGESPMELLPRLTRLSYSAPVRLDSAFFPFIEARQEAGHNLTVIHILR